MSSLGARSLVQTPRSWPGAAGASSNEAAVNEVHVGGVEVALQPLHPVALLRHHVGLVRLFVGNSGDLKLREGGRRLSRAHVGPQGLVHFDDGVGDVARTLSLKLLSSGSLGISRHAPVTSYFQPW